MTSNNCKTAVDKPQYFIGIDLGTTHTLVAYAPVKKATTPDEIQLLQIPQLVDRGEVSELSHLPSFRFHPATGQIHPNDAVLPFKLEPIEGDVADVVYGEWARRLGVGTQGRLIHSAKSWLSQPGSNQNPPLLPWGHDNDPGLHMVCAVTATTSYLNYIRTVWNAQFPDAPMCDQHLVITIPASFDENARALTVDCIEAMGLNQAFLLEEPSAALYQWNHQNQKVPDKVFQSNPLILVCDVGGGTTDFTLVEAGYGEGRVAKELLLKRLAVGDHLLLGGDNMDWALAHEAQAQLYAAQPKLKLSNLQWSQLVQQCRYAKEQMFSHPEMDVASISLLGGGRQLVGGQLRTQLSRERLESLLIQGFFPKVSLEANTVNERSGLVATGLRYAADAAITRHLAKFLCAHKNEMKGSLPTNILFNGGVFASPVFKQRMVEQLEAWAGEPVNVLEGTSVDAAVCMGAVVYGVAQTGGFSKIQGGSARSYFLRVIAESSTAEDQALCILPQGTQENTPLTTEKTFQLRVGQAVRFDLLSSTQDNGAEFSHVYSVAKHWIPLPALIVELSESEGIGVSQQGKGAIEVKLESELSEFGVLIVKCVEAQPKPKPGQKRNSWKLNFNTRKIQANNALNSGRKEHQAEEALPSQWSLAKTYISEIYGPSQKKPDPKQVKQLRVKLEKCLGPRPGWQTPLLRAVADELLSFRKNRRRSAQHERLWLNLLGYGLRPGMGFRDDEARVALLKSLWSGGLAYPKEAQNWVEWWTCWRRVSAGLDAEFQQQIWKSVKALLNPGTAKSVKQQQQLKLKSLEQMVRLAGGLERLGTKDKHLLAGWLIKWSTKQKINDAFYWALGRTASRYLLYGEPQQVLDPQQVTPWVEALLKFSWKTQPVIGFAVALMSRKHSEAEMNVSPLVRSDIKLKLQTDQCPESWVKLLDQNKVLSSEDQSQIFGEALPLGLSL